MPLQLSASLNLTGSLNLSGSFTATQILNATASQASTASFVNLAQSASYYGGSVTSASYALSSSYVNVSALNAFVQNGNSFGTTATLGTNDNQPLVFETSGSERLRIDSSGSVGIGTTSPLYKLDVRGDVLIKGGSTSHSVLRFRRNDSAYDFAYIGFEDPSASNSNFLISSNGNGNPLKLQTGVSNVITFFGDTTEYARINGSGNLGIGTTSPGYKLEVVGDIKANSSTINIQGNLNSLRGNVSTYGYNLTGSPSGTGWISVNTYHNALSSGDQLFQLAYDQYNQQKLFTRYSSDAGATWSSWKTIINSDALSGSTNYIPKFTGTNTVGNSAVYDSSGNIGIGTTSPNNPLHVYSSNNQPILLQGTTAGAWMDFQSSTSNLLSIGADGTRGFGFYNRTTSSDLMTISTSGNVGIGTTTPTARLNIASTSQTTKAIIQSVSAATGLGGYLAFNPGGDSTYSKVAIGVYDSYYGSYNRGNLAFMLNSAADATEVGFTDTKMYISASGNVGIGVTSPVAKLQVNGNISGSSFTSSISNAVGFVGTASYAVSASYAPSGGGGSGGSGTVTGSTNYIAKFTSATAVGDSILFDSGSRVGIGTTSMKQKLDVVGNISLTNANTTGYVELTYYETTTAKASIWINGSGQTDYAGANSMNIWQGSNAPIAFYTNGTNERMRITGGGNIGIGTTSPNSKLVLYTDFASINGLTISSDNVTDSQIVTRKAAAKPAFGVLAWDSQVFLSAGTYYDGNTWVQHSDDTNNELFVLEPGVGITWYASDNNTASWNVASNITLWDPSANWKSLVQSTRTGTSYFTGSVGIGTTSAITRFDVVDNSGSAAAMRIRNVSATGYSGIEYLSSTGSVDMYIGLEQAGGAGRYNNLSGGHRFYVSSAEKMRIDTSGNVGIGTSSPTSLLELSSSAASNLFHVKGKGTWGNSILFISSSGRVGIGTTNPTYGLYVYNYTTTQTGAVYIGAQLNSSGKGLVIDSNTRTTADNSVLALEIINRAGSNTMAATVEGNVGIGTTSPDCKLNVVGGVAAIGLDTNYLDRTYRTLYLGDRANNDSYAAINFNPSGLNSNIGFDIGVSEPNSTARYFNIVNNATSTIPFYINNSGNIGIGTTNPVTKLEVVGSIRGGSFPNLTTNTGEAWFGRASDRTLGTYTLQLGGSSATNTSFEIVDRAWTKVISSVSGEAPASSLIVSSSGNVGIGTAIPASALEVIGTVTDYVTFNRVTGSYTLALSDASKTIETNLTLSNTITIPSSSVVNFRVGTKIDVIQYGTGVTSITSGSTGVTLRSANNYLKINAQYGAATCMKVATNEWYVFGNLTA